jgi:hypothetical protein
MALKDIQPSITVMILLGKAGIVQNQNRKAKPTAKPKVMKMRTGSG